MTGQRGMNANGMHTGCLFYEISKLTGFGKNDRREGNCVIIELENRRKTYNG